MNKKVIIASKSPVKFKAVKTGFKKVFPETEFVFESISVPSEVSDQPLSNNETYKGAMNRCNNAIKKINNAYFWIGIEGGIQKFNDETEAFAWVYIKSKYKTGKARTATFFLPEKITKLIEQGIELGEADDIVFGLKDSKKQNGAVGILTKNVTDRSKYYSEAVILALIPFINTELY
ncbi:MAG: inosine/xanthosine triphosphatase [Bacteroidales bacterium]|nr:inosine/xanthosine triphosphatase [Bacteroidales bacterium]